MVDSNQRRNRTLSLICPMAFTKRTLRDDEKEPVKMQNSYNVTVKMYMISLISRKCY